jgi:cold shock CspA family protein
MNATKITGTGRVRMFNGEYGFITTESGQDIFFHQTRLKVDGVVAGSRVRFEASEGPKGLRADSVTTA